MIKYLYHEGRAQRAGYHGNHEILIRMHIPAAHGFTPHSAIPAWIFYGPQVDNLPEFITEVADKQPYSVGALKR